MTHEEIREQLALSAAGLLPPKGESNIRNHIAECASCAAQFEILAAISHELTALPAPSPSPDLLARTHVLMVAEAAAMADRGLPELMRPRMRSAFETRWLPNRSPSKAA